MTVSVVVHITGEEPIACELEEMPGTEAQIVTLNNPRRRDGKDLHYLEENVTRMIVPLHRINFIQVMPSAEVENIIGFVRE